MTERWHQVGALFDRALGIDAARRSEWLEGVDDDPAIVEEVRSLLRYDASEADLVVGSAESRVGARLGAYQLGEVIGSGGMGTVYAAERCDDEFRKRVAVKLVRPGMDSEHIIRRFRQERQVLASLEHPGIARLIDGGVTEDGRPYLVMEYVDGVSIDAWCNDHDLTIEERLELFTQVCAAVQHAHQNLVVHRDLKPGNIVVNTAAEVKLLDFGIAKVLERDGGRAGDATLTQAGGAPMTPRYASPEQIRGTAITTATDVYALGVVLYELMAGRSPYSFTTNTRDEIERVVCETTPPRPSTIATRAGAVGSGSAGSGDALRRRLAGDLDTIVLMAMHKDPGRRYASAAQLAEDIRRHLVGMPVLARPDSLAYRAERFVQRHRIGVTAGAFAVVALIVGLVVSTTLFFQARRAEQEATRRLDQVRAFSRTMMYDVHDRIETLPGATPVREFLVRTTLEYLDTIAAEAGADVERHRELGAGYQRMANVQGLDTSGSIGDVDGAQISAAKAIEHWALASALMPEDPDLAISSAVAHRTLADILAKSGRGLEAQAHYAQAKEIAHAVLETAPDHIRARRQLVTVALKLGDLLQRRGAYDAVRSSYEEALALTEALARDVPDDMDSQRDHGLALARLGRFEAQHGDREVGSEYLERSLARVEALCSAHPDNAQFRRDLAIAHERLGDLELESGDRDAALVHYQANFDILRGQGDLDPASTLIRQNLSIAIEKVADVHMAGERFADALALYRQSLALTRALSESDPANVTTRFYVALCNQSVGAAQQALGDPAGSEESFRRMMEICGALVASDPDVANHFMGFVIGAVRVGEIRLGLGRPDDAIEILRHAEHIARGTLDRNADRDWAKDHYGLCCETLARAFEQRGDEESRSRAARADDLRSALQWYEQVSGESRDANLARCAAALEALGE